MEKEIELVEVLFIICWRITLFTRFCRFTEVFRRTYDCIVCCVVSCYCVYLYLCFIDSKSGRFRSANEDSKLPLFTIRTHAAQVFVNVWRYCRCVHFDWEIRRFVIPNQSVNLSQGPDIQTNFLKLLK